MKIVFLDRTTIAGDVSLGRPDAPHEWIEHDSSTTEEALSRLAGATVAITNKVRLPRDLLQDLPDLKLIAIAATGTDNVDLTACRDLGIEVRNVTDYAATTVTEHTFALLLALRRSLPSYVADVANGQWQASGQFCFHTYPIGELRGRRMAIVGSGAIGGAVADIARAVGMEVVFAGRKGDNDPEPGLDKMPFDEVLGWCDVLSLHCPLTEATRNMIGRAEFERMSRRPVILNTARGDLISEPDLAAALEQGLISGAAVDAVSSEPPPLDHPFMRLVGRHDFILTPHVAWAGRDAMQTLADQLIRNIEDWASSVTPNK